MNGLLFVDDEEGVRRSVVRALRKEPYPVAAVETGEAAVKLVRKDRARFDAVISDYRMPGLDGLETLKAIGRINPEITRIILTGYATMEAAIDATNEGIDGFLTKPFDNRQLCASIKDIAVRKRLRQFVSHQVYEEIRNSTGAIEPRFHPATVLFSDIRGFTAMSVDVRPEAVAAFLNERYFGPMGEIAFRYGGTVDKHIGDGIMVVFGSPVTRPDDALRAVRAAVAMQRTAARIDSRLAASGSGFRLRTGIGLSSGKVFSGVLGSLRKKEFTSVGTTVNIASRLQSLAKPGEIIAGEETVGLLHGRVRTEVKKPVLLRGIDRPLTVYRIPVWPADHRTEDLAADSRASRPRHAQRNAIGSKPEQMRREASTGHWG